MACPDYDLLVRKYGEGGIPAPEERLLREHLEECGDCRKTVKLLDLDDEALAAVLLGPPRASIPEVPPRRLLRFFALAIALLLAILAVLWVLYDRIGKRRSPPPGIPSGESVDFPGVQG